MPNISEIDPSLLSTAPPKGTDPGTEVPTAGNIKDISPDTLLTPDQFKEQKYGTVGQQALTAIEGAGHGFAGPGATLLESGLSKLGVPGLTPEDQAAREETNPATHIASEVAGFGAGAFTGTGEAGLLAKVGEAASGLAKGTSIAAKIGSSGLKVGAELAALQAGDEISKTINQDPNQTLGSAAINVGLSGILGGAGGVVLGSVSPLFKTIGNKTGITKLAADFIDEIKFLQENPEAGYDPSIRSSNGPTTAFESASEINAGRGTRGIETGQSENAGALRADATPVKGLPASSPGPTQEIRDLADSYISEKQLPAPKQYPYVKPDPERASKIAQAYEEMEHAPNDPKVKAAYSALVDETKDQFQKIKDTGLKIEAIKPGMENPYPNGSADMVKDVRSGHLWFFPTEEGFGSSTEVYDPFTKKTVTKSGAGAIAEGERSNLDPFTKKERLVSSPEKAPSGNPLLAPTGEVIDGHKLLANDVFRIVHDVFGHAKEGFGFGAAGEENAWLSHSRMYSEEARKALTTETRGQNSWVNFGPLGEANRANPLETTYAQQKVGLLPDWVMKEGIPTLEGEKSKVSPGQALAQWAHQKGASVLAKSAGETAAGTVGALSGSLIGHPIVGALAGEKLLAPIFSALAKPFAETAVNSEAMRSSVDYLAQAIKGDMVLNKSVKDFFTTSEIIPKHLLPTADSRAKLEKSLASVEAPDNLLKVGGNLSHYLPDHGTAAGAIAGTSVNYLNSLKPKSAPENPFDAAPPIDKAQQAKYNRALDIAQQPLTVLKRAQEGTLLPEDVQTLQMIYPGLHSSMVTKVNDELIAQKSQGKPIPYAQRMGLSLLIGSPLDSSMTSQSMQAVITSAVPQAEQGQPNKPGSKASATELRAIEKSNRLYPTSLQQNQIQSRK